MRQIMIRNELTHFDVISNVYFNTVLYYNLFF